MMRRKSERSKGKTSPEKKTEPSTMRRSSRRRNKKSPSTSPEREEEPREETMPISNEQTPEVTTETKEVPKQPSNSNSDEEKTEKPVWQVKTTENPDGEIRKLKICLQRPSHTPERLEKSERSPRRHRHRRRASVSQTDEDAADSSEEKPRSERKTTRRSRRENVAASGVEDSSQDDSMEKSPTRAVVQSANKEITDDSNAQTSVEKPSIESQNPNTETNSDKTNTEIDPEKGNTDIASEKPSTETDSVKANTDTDSEKPRVETVSNLPAVETESNLPPVETESNLPAVETGSDLPAVETESNLPAVETGSNLAAVEIEKANTESRTEVEVHNNEETQKGQEGTFTPERNNETETKEIHENIETKTVDIIPKVDETNDLKNPENQQHETTEQKINKESPEKMDVDEVEAVSVPVADKSNNEVEKEKTDVEKETSEPEPKATESVKETHQSDRSETGHKSPEKSENQPTTPEIQKEEIEPPKSQRKRNKRKKSETSESDSESDCKQESQKRKIQSSISIKSRNGEHKDAPSTGDVVLVEDESSNDVGRETVDDNNEVIVIDNEARKNKLLKEATLPLFDCVRILSSDNLQDIIDFEILPVEKLKLEIEQKSSKKVSKSSSTESKTKSSSQKKTVENGAQKAIIETAMVTEQINPMTANRKISIVNDDLQRPASPAKHKPSSILYIKNLVRPFTLNQLKELLSRTGNIIENGFWINKIKSECYVHYETEEQAVETRNALHGVHWPIANGRRLNVDFGTEKDLEQAREQVDAPVKSERKVEPNHVPEQSPQTTKEEKVQVKEEVDWRQEREKEKERREQRGIREWDVGKRSEQQRSPSPPPHKRSRHSDSPHHTERKRKKDEEQPAKMLDDLFRKTKATPCIYWLPLSAEMIVIKEEQRRKHMAEHERRLAELRRAERERMRSTGGRPPRHSSRRYE